MRPEPSLLRMRAWARLRQHLDNCLDLMMASS